MRFLARIIVVLILLSAPFLNAKPLSRTKKTPLTRPQPKPTTQPAKALPANRTAPKLAPPPLPPPPRQEPIAQHDANFGVGLNFGYVYVGLGYGVEAWYEPKSNIDTLFQILTGYGEVRADSHGTAQFEEYISMRTMEVALKLRWFFAPIDFPSLFVPFSIGYDQLSGDYGAVTTEAYAQFHADEKHARSYSATATVAQLGIGNLWKLSGGWTFGAEWLTVVFPVSLSAQFTGNETIPQDILNPDDTEGDLRRALRKQIQVKAGVATLGFAF